MSCPLRNWSGFVRMRLDLADSGSPSRA
jgi:hypothetical protein